MLKSLTFCAALALALGASSMSFAGGIFHKATPSAQCETPSPQSVAPSPQGECGAVCGPVKKHHFADMMAKLHKPKCYTYEWVLKKKRVHGGCASPACETCGETAYPSAQYPSAQGGWSTPQAVGTGQMAPTTSSQITPAPAAVEPPAAPVPPPPPTASNGGVLFLTPAGN